MIPKHLFSDTHRHPKIVKNGREGVLSMILHLAPADRSGYEVCPMRSKGCTAACLNTAGFQYARKENARVTKTKLFFENRALFMAMLVREIETAEHRCRRRNMVCGVRLNGTSDIPWEKIPFTTYKTYANIMERFPDVSFMDYTKRPNRRNLPPNYRLTFSKSEDNLLQCLTAIGNGMNVAVVFNVEKDEPLPERWTIGYHNLRVINGDAHDWRYDDNDDFPDERLIIGLRVKGFRGRADRTGFVVTQEQILQRQREMNREEVAA